MKYLSILLLTVMIITISSCGTGGGVDKALISGKNWKRTAFTVSPAIDYDNNGSTETDLMQFDAACKLDNFVNFSSTGTLTLDEGPNLCAGQNQTNTATWAWSSTGNDLLIAFGSGADTIRVKSLSATTLQVEADEDFNGTPVVTLETYTAQ